MNTNKLITKFRFLEYGKKAPKGSRFKGNISTGSLIGWMDYTSRDAAADKQKQQTMHEGGLIGYTSQNDSIRTYSSDGWLDDKKMKDFKAKIADSFHTNGNLCWDTVVSLRDYVDSDAAGMHDVNDYAALVAKLLPSYFKSMGLDSQNMIWWMNYHNNKKNPHMHITFLEKTQTRTRGKITPRALDAYKTMWLKELGMRQEFEKEYGISSLNVMKEKDELKKSLLDHVCSALKENTLLETLYQKLPKTGRLSYNSIHMKPYRKDIDEIIKIILNSKEVKPIYNQWYAKVEQLDAFQNKIAGDNISHFKETEINKMYSRIGNMILQQSKDEFLNKMHESSKKDERKISSKHTTSYYNKKNKNWGSSRKNIQALKRGAKRLLSQDEREKERDLEQFIRAFEDQQVRIEEKEMYY